MIENHFNYVDLTVNLGIDGAAQMCYKYTLKNGYDETAQVDADGQHDAAYLKNLVTKMGARQGGVSSIRMRSPVYYLRIENI